MITYNTPITESLALLTRIAPASQAAAAYNTGNGVDMGLYGKLVFVVNLGTTGASGTVDFKLQAAPTSGGAFVDLTGYSITQLTATGVALVEISSETLVALETAAGTAALNKYRWVRGVLTVGVSASVVGVEVFGALGRFHRPENLANTVDVKQIVRPVAATAH
jgi:hypothetical protein